MRRILLAAGLLLFGAGKGFAAGPVNSPWPQAYGNAQHTSSTTATSPSRLKLAWTANVEPPSNGNASVGAAIGADGSVYVVSPSSVAKYSASGVPQWAVHAGSGGISLSAAAISDDGLVHMSNYTFNIPYYAVTLSTQTGAVVSQTAAMCNSFVYFPNGSSPLLTNGGTVYFSTIDSPNGSGSNNGCFSSIAPNAQLSWENTADFSGQQSGPMAMAIDESGVFVGQTTGLIEKISPDSSVPVRGASGSYRRMAVGQNGNLYVISGTAVTALNPSTLATIWTYSGSNFDSNLAVSGNTVFFSSYNLVQATLHNTYVIALNATTGALVWNADLLAAGLGGWPTGYTPLGSAGQITVAGSDLLIPTTQVSFGTTTAVSFITALDAATGSRRWTEPQPAGANGVAYAGQPIPANTALYSFNKSDLFSYQASGASTLTVSKTTGTVIPESNTTITASIKNSGGSGIPGLAVFMYVSAGQAAPAANYGYTDAAGNFSVTFSSNSLNSSVVESTFTVRVVAQDFSPVDVPIFLEGEAIDHFDMATPSTTSIGVPFAVSV